jgi:hypothetical protein
VTPAADDLEQTPAELTGTSHGAGDPGSHDLKET